MHENIHNNPQVLQQIEWELLRNSINNCCHFPNTSSNLFNYLHSRKDIEYKLQQTKKFDHLFFENDYKDLITELGSIPNEFDYNALIDRIKKEGVLDILELNSLCLLIEFLLTQYKSLYKNDLIIYTKEEFNKFKQSITRLFLKEFRQFVDSDGTVDYSKHPQLRGLFQEQLKLESTIRQKITETLNNNDFKAKLQFASYDLINERYVIPIKSDSFQNNLGVIVSRSDSGNTLYVEPRHISELNYKRLEVLVKIKNIISTLEVKLSKTLSVFCNELSLIKTNIYFLDEFHSRVQFAKRLSLSEPILTEKKTIKLMDYFHPLIENPVKNNIEITENNLGMIISGPNTGGKTATLKAVALTQLLLRYGFYIPCSYGEVFLYEKVFYFGNDQQDLNMGLSSFSAEVHNYSTLFESLGSTNLILIDEIFNSTSSEEASALAVSLFNAINKISDIHIIVSSHHQTLKTFLHEDDKFISAHVGYDIEKNGPTYKLYTGAPGSSQALNIFKSITKNNEIFQNIYTNSLQFLDNKIIHYEKLLESLSKKENELTNTLKENRDINLNLKNQKQAMDGVIKLKIDERIKKTDDKLQKILQKAENLITEVKQGNITKSKNLYKKQHDIKKDLSLISPKKEMDDTSEDYTNLSIPNEVIIGESYFSLKLKKTVKVLSKTKKDAQVKAGHFTMKVPLNSLRLANQKVKSKTKIIPQAIPVSRTRDIKLEYDCRGMRLEEFQNIVELAISDLLLSNSPYINIIHGHGTGVLKKWLRDYIKKHKDVTVDKNETGNDGETRIILL
jgi:DNA mismatch repair protein MutS2